jgi:beta-phosphoglucomutase-like phosphatase (HAD superfamily)
MTAPASPRAVLWDMDGVLVDSAEYHYAAWREALAREGVDLSYDAFRATFGQRNDAILRLSFRPRFAGFRSGAHRRLEGVALS